MTEYNDVSLKTVRLELARTKDYPDGNPNHGYVFHAPLNDDGHLDKTAWSDTKELCSVRRFEDDLEDEHGLLLHLGPDRWVFSYEPGEEDDEPLFRLSLHRFQEGEYVSITEHDGEQRTFQVVSVQDYVSA